MKKIIMSILVVLCSTGFAFAQDNVDSLVGESQKKAKFQTHIHLGLGRYFCKEESSFGSKYLNVFQLDTSIGARLNKNVYIGGLLDVACHTNLVENFVTGRSPVSIKGWMIFSLAPNVKIHFPCKKRVAPYIDLSVGASIDTQNKTGLFWNIGGGLDINRFSVALGYKAIYSKRFGGYKSYNEIMHNMLILQLGVRLGKM